MGGIGLSSKTSTEHHTAQNSAHTRTQIRTYIHIHLNNIYICTENRTQYAHRTHTICTHTTQRTTICSTQNSTYKRTQNKTQNNVQNRTHNLNAQNNTLVHTLFTYIVLILLFNVHIKKLYNTAIY